MKTTLPQRSKPTTALRPAVLPSNENNMQGDGGINCDGIQRASLMDGEVADELAPLTSNSGSERHTASDPQRGQAEEGTESTLFADNKRKLDAMLKQCTAVQDQVLRVRVSLAMTRSEQARLVNPIVMQTLARKRRVYETASSRY